MVAGGRRSSVVIVCTKLEFAMVALNRASGGLSAKRAIRMLQHIRKECAEERFGSALPVLGPGQLFPIRPSEDMRMVRLRVSFRCFQGSCKLGAFVL